MLTTLALALLLTQDPKPAAKTVEDRVKELADKIEALDKKAAALSVENAKLQLQVKEVQERRDAYARQSAPMWAKRYAPAVEFSEKQSAEIEELWYGWTKQDFEKACDVAGWKAREDILRGKLTPEQATNLARKVREEQESNITFLIKHLVRAAKLPVSMEETVGKVVRPKMPPAEGVILLAAHPEKGPSWTKLTAIVDAHFADLTQGLSEDQAASLRKALTSWKQQ